MTHRMLLNLQLESVGKDYTSGFLCNRSLHHVDKHKVNSGAGTGFFPVFWTVQQMIDHLKNGHAIDTGYYGKVDNYDYPKTDTAHWTSSRLLIIDCDNRSHHQLKADDFVSQYACVIYPTPSSTLEHPRSRAIFLLDTPITDKDQYKELAETLTNWTLSNLDPDQKANKLTQRVYGASKSYFTEQPDNVLPLSVIKYQVALYRAEKYLYGLGKPEIKKVSSASPEFSRHSENTDNLLSGETLAVGERNDRINQASYNLTIRGMDSTAIMRKLLPLATASGLGIREGERSIESGIKGATRNAQSQAYIDNTKNLTMTDEAKQLLITVMRHNWQSGYTAKVAIAMCKIFSRQGQGFYLTQSLIERMTGFDKGTVAKQLQHVLATKIFRGSKRKSIFYATARTADTTLTIDEDEYQIDFNIFNRLLENRTQSEVMAESELKIFCEFTNGTHQRKDFEYSIGHSQKALSRLIQWGILVREGLRYWFVSMEGMFSGTTGTRDMVRGNSGTHQTIELKAHHFLQQQHELEHQNTPKNQFIDDQRRVTP